MGTKESTELIKKLKFLRNSKKNGAQNRSKKLIKTCILLKSESLNDFNTLPLNA